MVQMLRTCQSSRTSYLQPPRKYLPVVVRTIGDPLFDDVGPRVDDQLQLGVLLPVLPVSTLSSSFTVSTSMFSKRLMICANLGDLVSADLGNFVLELVEDLDPEGPCVGGKSGLGVSVVLAAFSTWVFVSVSTSTFLEKSIVGADLSEFVSQTCWWSQS